MKPAYKAYLEQVAGIIEWYNKAQLAVNTAKTDSSAPESRTTDNGKCYG